MKPITKFKERILICDEDGKGVILAKYVKGFVLVNRTILATSEALELAAWFTAAAGQSAMEEANRLRAAHHIVRWRKTLTTKRKAKS